MKKSNIYILLLFISANFSAQTYNAANAAGSFGIENVRNGYVNEIGNVLRSKDVAKKDSDIEGSVYINKDYQIAKISGVEESWPIRYDAFRDEIEVKKDKEVFALKKEEAFNEINFTATNTRVIYTEYDLNKKKQTGYLFEVLATPAVDLYKKETVTFKKGKEANTTLEIAVPNRFVAQDPVYLIKDHSNGKFIQLDKKAKMYVAEFPAKKDLVKKCGKESNFNLSNEASVKSFTTCLYK